MNKTMCEGFSYYLPYTFEQFAETFNGRPKKDFHQFTGVLELLFRIPFTPVDVAFRTAWNGGKTCIKIVEWFSVSLLFPFKYAECKKKWSPVTLEVIDRALMTALSPFQSPVKSIRIFIAIFFPQTFFVSLETLVKSRRTEIELREKVCKTLRKLTEISSSKGTLSFHILKGFFKYADRCTLLRTYDDPSTFDPLTAILFSRHRNWIYFDTLSDRIQLFEDFNDFFQKNVEEINKKSLVTFFKEKLKTKRQKQVLAEFLSKDSYGFNARGMSFYKKTDIDSGIIEIRRYLIEELKYLNVRGIIHNKVKRNYPEIKQQLFERAL
jgi:hypothetical protein